MGSANKVILVIEDDVFLGDVLVKKLNSAGLDAHLARDGESGLAQIKALKPDLVLLDIILPKKTGYEVLEEKNKDPELKDIPVVVVSNSGQPVEIDKALSMGVKDYLVKAQFDPEEVLVKVNRQLGTIERAKSSGQNSSLKGRKVMWVEDDKFLSDIISRKLTGEGCVLVHSTNGDDALSKVEDEQPDIIVLDIMLSGIDGFEILRRLKENEKVKNIPVILLSNLGQKTDIDKGESLGAAKFLVKASMTLDEIVDEVKTTLGSQK